MKITTIGATAAPCRGTGCRYEPAEDLVDVAAHEQYLKERLPKVGAELPGLPVSATPKKLLELDLGERNPFAASGNGFRDALNWETPSNSPPSRTVGQIYCLEELG